MTDPGGARGAPDVRCAACGSFSAVGYCFGGKAHVMVSAPAVPEAPKPDAPTTNSVLASSSVVVGRSDAPLSEDGERDYRGLLGVKHRSGCTRAPDVAAPLSEDGERELIARYEQVRDPVGEAPYMVLTVPDVRPLVLAADNLCALLRSVLVERERYKTEKDGAYLERNRLVAALARLFPSGVARTAIPGWSEDWHGCVYVDLPTGQASWHFHDSQAYLFAGLPPYPGEWDGHTTDEKYERLAALKGTP